MGVTLKRILALAVTLLLAAPAALAQTAPNLVIFEPGTAIRADEMNANSGGPQILDRPLKWRR